MTEKARIGGMRIQNPGRDPIEQVPGTHIENPVRDGHHQIVAEEIVQGLGGCRCCRDRVGQRLHRAGQVGHQPWQSGRRAGSLANRGGLPAAIAAAARPGDLVLTMGAGDITALGPGEVG